MLTSAQYEMIFTPVRNNASLLPPGQRPSGPVATAESGFIIIPGGNAPLEFLTGFTSPGSTIFLGASIFQSFFEERT